MFHSSVFHLLETEVSIHLQSWKWKWIPPISVSFQGNFPLNHDCGRLWGIWTKKNPASPCFMGKKRTSVHGSNGDQLCVKAGLLITGWSYKEPLSPLGWKGLVGTPRDPGRSLITIKRTRWWQLKDFLFSPLFGEDFQFDDHIFQMGWWKTTNQRIT